MWMLGTSWNCFLRYEITDVTRENGSRRDPYPPTTVSLLTNPRRDCKSARTTRISHLDADIPNSAGGNGDQADSGGPRGERGENARLLSSGAKGPWRTPRERRTGTGRSSSSIRAAGASF